MTYDSMRKTCVLGLLCGTLLVVSGCMGPSALRATRNQYNRAMSVSEEQQLLLNLVRVRYRETPRFLQVGAINATFDFGALATFDGTFPDGGPNVFGAGAQLGYSETPTITYTPLQGAEFAQRTQKEIPLEDLVLLIRGGWEIDTVMRIMVDRLGFDVNLTERPSYQDFLELVTLWREVEKRGNINFVVAPGGPPTVIADALSADQVTVERLLQADRDGYSLQRNPDGTYRLLKPSGRTLVMQISYASEAEADRADALLGFRTKRVFTDMGITQRLQLVDPVEAYDPPAEGQAITRVPIWLRSFANQLYYAARGIDIPPEDLQFTKIFRTPEGQVHDPRTALKDIFDVRSSKSRPDHAYVAVHYRGRWFYIDDRDQITKDTFAMLSLIFALQSKEQGVKPVLTIPVGGR